MLSEYDYVSHCLGKTQSRSKCANFALVSTAKAFVLLPCFVEAAFFALHWQYLTITPDFKVDLKLVQTDSSGGLPTSSGSQDQIAIDRDLFCQAST